MHTDHFGSGRDPEAILNKAHETGAIVLDLLDLLDLQSNALEARTFTGLVEGGSESARRQMIFSALALFFE